MRPILSLLGRAHDRVTDAGVQLGKLCLGVIVFAYVYEVVARYFFGAPTWWANEVVSYALCIGCFLLMPHVTREKGHIAVTLVLDLLDARRASRLNRFLYFMGFVVCGAATWISLDENIRQVVQDVHLMKVRPIPKIYISAWITYGFASSALYFLRHLLDRGEPVAGVREEARI